MALITGMAAGRAAVRQHPASDPRACLGGIEGDSGLGLLSAPSPVVQLRLPRATERSLAPLEQIP